jgi:Mg-chelatase subunit ChlD
MSESKKHIENYINEQISSKNKNDDTAVIVFGKEPMIEIPFKAEEEKVEFHTQPNSNFTNIEKAVEFAVDYFPQDSNKRLVLITDGCENSGQAYSCIQRLIDEKVNLVIYPIENNRIKDVQLTCIDVPQYIHRNEEIPVTITIDSTEHDKGNFYLYCNNERIFEKEIKVEKGSQKYTFALPLEQSGDINLKGEIDFEKDTNKLNNRITVSAVVEDEPKILVVGDEEDIKNVRSLLQSIGINYMVYSPYEVPYSMEFLSDFEEIFLVNVSHDSINEVFENNLQKCVMDLGCGLVVVGGKKSFALGGYEETKLEKMFPVQCRMKDNKKQPDMGLILLIDCSGSMEDESGGIKKIELAKEAAVQAIKAVENGDYIGVLAFSDTLEWIVPFGKVEDKNKLIAEIGRLKSKGGTLIIPSLSESVEKIKAVKAKVKHMILLTDGQGEKEGYEVFASEMKENNITLSTVAVGNDADKTVLKYLADYTGGREYYAKDFNSVPKIFARETYIASKKYINNYNFNPIQVSSAAYFQENNIPELKGYTGTGIKNGSTLILKSPKEDPILAAWQYGLGRVVAWTSDLNGQWSENIIKWDGFHNMWSSLINWGLRGKENRAINVQVNREGSDIEVFVDAAASDSSKYSMVDMVINGPKNFKEEITLNSISPGKYKGNFSAEYIGSYFINIRLKSDNSVLENISRSIHIDYSSEYNIDNNTGKNILERLTLISVGKLVIGDENIFKEPLIIKNYSFIDMDLILLLIVLVVFFLDVILRMTKGIN